VHGQDHPRSGVAAVLPDFLRDPRIAVVAENIANIPGYRIISTSNLMLSKNRGNSPPYPDLILHSGGQVVSKALTGYLRRAPEIACWRIGTEEKMIDTFRLVTQIIPYPPALVYRALYGFINSKGDEDYGTRWLSLTEQALKLGENFTRSAPFSDLPVFQKVLHRVPDDSLVVLGNSSIIRYAQLFPARPTLTYFANRGVSGIDGCLSTAAGIAHSSGKLTLAITGDLSFLYDSNALWNRELPVNLKIVVINNRGGGIFHILKGPADHPGFAPFIEANHPVNIPTLAMAFGIGYYVADDLATLEKQWGPFIQEQQTAALLEVKTDAAASAEVFRQLMDASRSGT
jgi:2-succinyl-5-enolpyruvyl-6-hydroxy-3-cyclohexene-1-carboxylate synthase